MGFFINNTSDSGTDWAAIISSFSAVIVGIVAIYYSYRQFTRTLEEKKEEERRKDIYTKLNEFYGPLLQLRKKSNLLYEKFKANFILQDPNFSTLTYLLQGNTMTGNDKVLLDEIIKIGEQCEALIHNKSGLIDDDNLRNLIIPKVTTHFLVLRLAYNNVLIGDSSKYTDLVFPRNFDFLIEQRIKQLESTL